MTLVLYRSVAVPANIVRTDSDEEALTAGLHAVADLVSAKNFSVQSGATLVFGIYET